MAKALKTIGIIAGAVALVATGVGLAYGGFAAAATAGTAGAAAGAATAATALNIAAYAGIAAGVANLGAALTYSQKPPRAQGSVTQIIIDPDAPQPYVMGEGYVSGILRHDCAYGATLKKVPNPYRWMVLTFCGCGPIASITPYVDQAAVSSYYDTYLITATRLGATPDTVLTPAFGTAPGWDNATAGLSGYASIGWSLKFDKDGKRFASGLPQLGAYGQWVKVYDPRLDSTYPGGSGSHRLGTENTYAYSANPALHAAMYAYGRYQNSKRVFGMGLDSDAIDWAAVVAWANVCDSNGWEIFGRIFEPMPETRWPNLQEICAAGGGKPIVSGGTLTFHYNAPRVVLDTFTEADLADGERSVTAMMSRRRRVNRITPKYRSPDHNWELVAAADDVTSATYVTEDGETRKAEWPFNLVKDVDQAAALAAYELANGRELTPITLTFGDRVRAYKPGDCVHLNINLKKADGSDDTVLDLDAVILTRQRDHASQTTTFSFISETAAKHAFALGQSGTAPASPTLTPQTGEERDEIASGAAPGSPVFLIDGSSPVIRYDENGALVSGQTITLQVNREKLTGNVEVRLYRVLSGGSQNTLDAGTYLTGSGTVTDNSPNSFRFLMDGDTITLTGTNFNTAIGSGIALRIEVYQVDDPTYYSIAEIKKLLDGTAGNDGAPGVSPINFNATAFLRTIKYDAQGQPDPAVQTNLFFVQKGNTSATVTWSVKDLNGVSRTPTASYLSAATGDSVTQTEAQFAAASNGTGGVVVIATITDGATYTDQVDVKAVTDGPPLVGFKQDSPVPTATFADQTWYRPTSKEWYIAAVAGANEIKAGEWERVLGDLSAYDSVDTDLIDPEAVTQTVSTTSAINVGIGGAEFGEHYCIIKLNIATTGEPVHILTEIIARVSAVLGDISAGDELFANMAITRGPIAIPITLFGNPSPTQFDSYVTSDGTQLVAPHKAKAFTYSGGASYSNVFSDESPVVMEHIDSPPAGSYTYGIWMGPGTADSVAATRARQRLKLTEFKR